nr:protein ALP1-like isoform X1 [Tanacetum cinerariifolium]
HLKIDGYAILNEVNTAYKGADTSYLLCWIRRIESEISNLQISSFKLQKRDLGNTLQVESWVPQLLLLPQLMIPTDREFLKKPEHLCHLIVDLLSLYENGILKPLHLFEFATGGAVNFALKMKGEMVIKNLNLKLTIDAMMRDFLESNNDINVLHKSPLFNDLKTRRAPEIPFVANGVTYPCEYYLVDEIYPELAPLVKTVPEPSDDDYTRIRYKKMQESARKDVQRVFGV